MKVTVFGSSKPAPGDVLYEDAYLLGKLLGKKCATVLTGGYIGTMEAVSKGAWENGAHVIGVTCTEVENWRSVGANAWVKEEWRFDTLQERLIALIDGCDAAIALPGGVGTLTEILLMWNRMVISAIKAKPLIIVGKNWHLVMDSLRENQLEYFSPPDFDLISLAPDIEAAISLIHPGC